MSLSEDFYKNDATGLSIFNNLDFFVNNVYNDFILGNKNVFKFSQGVITLKVILRVCDYYLLKPYLGSDSEIVLEMCFFDKPTKNDVRNALLACLKQFFRKYVTLDNDTFQAYNTLDNLN